MESQQSRLGTGKKAFDFEQQHVSIISDIKLSFNDNKKRVDAYISALCTSGEARVSVNQKEYKMSKNDLLVCWSGDEIRSLGFSDDFNACGFLLSWDFFKELSSIPLGLINARVYIAEHPLFHLSEHAALIFTQYYELIRSKLTADIPFKHHQLVSDLLLQAFMYEMHDTLESTLKVPANFFTSGENLYKQFMELILKAHPKPRSVAWYADQLNVTPKYLSSVCKNCSGETALAVINRYVLEEVKRYLLRPEMSIKEIVAELNFPSISFFGKYVKKNLGVSPKYYRQRITESM